MTIDDQVTVRDEVKRILSEARNAIRNIEVEVDDLNSLMFELLWPNNLSEEAQALANDLGVEANRLFGDLNKHFERLRREIAADDVDDGGGEADEADEAD
jgi:hypothetical protein